MAQTIQIKRSSSTATPTSLQNGELAYSATSNKLFIGRPGGGTGDVDAIGGKVYVDMLDHTAGTLTASSAIVVDSSSKINNLLVDNLQFDGNAITSTNANGDLSITPDGTGNLILDGLNWPQVDGSPNQYLKTDGSGQLSWDTVSTSFTLSDGTATDTFNTGGTLTFTGGTGVTTAVTNDEVTFSIGQDVSTSANVTFNTVTADLTGDVTGNVTGNLTGNVTGNVTGDLTGDVTGDVTGNVTGDITSTGTSTFSTVDINGGAIDGTTIGASSASTGAFTTLTTSGNATIGGDLTVNGTVTSVNSTTVELGDNIIVLNSGETGTPSANAGIEIERGTSANVLLRWNETSDKWEVTQDGTNYYVLIDTNNFETEITSLDGGTF